MAKEILAVVKPCVKCGAADRMPNGKCRPCRNAARRRRYAADPRKAIDAAVRWNEANQEKKKAADAKRYAENSKKFKAAATSWYLLNKKQARAKQAQWQAENRGKRRVYYNNREARKAATNESLSKGLVEKLLFLQQRKCPCCGLPLGTDYHLDHKMPLALGGTNTDDNMQLLRSTCNQQKHAKHPVDFMQERGFLL